MWLSMPSRAKIPARSPRGRTLDAGGRDDRDPHSLHQGHVDRHGHARHYFRKRGLKPVLLPGVPGSAEFMEAYQIALGAAGPKMLRTVPPKRGKNADLRTREHLTVGEVEALIEAARGNGTPPRRHHDPAGHPARAAGVRGLRPPLGSSRLPRRRAACPPGQERHPKHTPDPGRRVEGSAPASPGGPGVTLHLREQTGLALHDGRLRPDDRARRGCRWLGAQGAPAHAAPRLRASPTRVTTPGQSRDGLAIDRSAAPPSTRRWRRTNSRFLAVNGLPATVWLKRSGPPSPT